MHSAKKLTISVAVMMLLGEERAGAVVLQKQQDFGYHGNSRMDLQSLTQIEQQTAQKAMAIDYDLA